MSAVVGIAWTVYGIVSAIFFVFSIGFTRHYQDKHNWYTLSTITTALSLWLGLSCLGLLSVDTFLVSSTVDSRTGLKKEWATPAAVASITSGLQWVYYGYYSLIGFFCFFFIPFAYFYCKEKQRGDQSLRDRLRGACKYASFFVAIFVLLFLFALFLKPTGPPLQLDLDWFKQILMESNGEKTIAFVIACLVFLGLLLLIGYTAPGLSLFPLDWIKGENTLDIEKHKVHQQLLSVSERQKELQAKYTGNNKVMAARDARKMGNMIDEERILARQLRGIEEEQKNVWQRIMTFLRPLKVAIGMACFGLTLLIILSMILTCIDKFSSSICGRQCGFITSTSTLLNPINFIFVNLSKWFPLDYMLLVILVLYFFMATQSGLANMGIRVLWMNIYGIRRNGTTPQQLLVTAFLLTLSLLALNYAVTTVIAPGYAHYGNQVYCNYSTIGNKRDCHDRNEYIIPCDLKAPTELCTPTVSSILVDRVLVNTPFLGLVFYYSQWAFIAMFLIGSLVAVCRQPRSSVDDDAMDDMEQQGLLSSSSSSQDHRSVSYH